MKTQEVDQPFIFTNQQVVEQPFIFNESLIKKSVSFVVDGDPFGKQRPRFVRRGRFVSTYTPKETVDYENKVKKSYINKYNNEKLKVPVKAEIEAYFKIPKNTSKKKRKLMLEREIIPTIKPDGDNIGKAVLDPLNKLAYDDDAGVADLSVKKYYHEHPLVWVKIKEI